MSISRKPIEYQRGWVEFYKLRFKLNSNVFIPRPETELLVDGVINFARYDWVGKDDPQAKLKILDLGTGSGNIAISIAKNFPRVEIVATEVSPEALEMAKLNAKLHGVEAKIQFLVSDLLDSIEGKDFDVIVTNLPYIPTERIAYLDESVKDFEPHVALDGGSDGFGLYRKTFEQLKNRGMKIALLLGEIDYTHADLAIKESNKYFPQAKAEVKLDLTHRQRILEIRNY